MADYDLVQGDSGIVLRATISDKASKDLVDLTGKTVKVLYSLNGGATQERTMTALDQTTNKGKAEYQLLSSDLTSSGELKGEIRLQSGQSDQFTTVNTFFLNVKKPLS